MFPTICSKIKSGWSILNGLQFFHVFNSGNASLQPAGRDSLGGEGGGGVLFILEMVHHRAIFWFMGAVIQWFNRMEENLPIFEHITASYN